MRELERQALTATATTSQAAAHGSSAVGVVGAGRLGTAIAAALRQAGYRVEGPLRRGQSATAEVVLLCVPDAQITAACASALRSEPEFVGHTSGAATLAALAPARAAGAQVFSMHPLQTFSGEANPSFDAVPCAIAGSSQAACTLACELAQRLGMECFTVPEKRRALYHAAAAVASNFLITIESLAEQLAAGTGLDHEQARRLLGPLVRSSVENWQSLGPVAALTGPIARGDEETVQAQRAAVTEQDPSLGDLFDVLCEQTRRLAAGSKPANGGRRSK